MKTTQLLSILLTVFLLTMSSCGISNKESSPEYTTKDIKALDQFYYEYNGYNYNAYMCYFGDNTGFARVFVLQYGNALGYKDTWFEIRINDANNGLTYTSTDVSKLDGIPFNFEISKTNNYSVCFSQDGFRFPIRVKPVGETEMQDVLVSVKIPLQFDYPN